MRIAFALYFWYERSSDGQKRGGNVARCIAVGVPTPLAKSPLPLVAQIAAIHITNPY